MIVEPLIQCGAGIDIFTLTAFSRTFWYGLAYINRTKELAIFVDVGQCGICGEIPDIVKSIDSGTNESARRQRLNILCKKRLGNLLTEMALVATGYKESGRGHPLCYFSVPFFIILSI